MHTRRALSAIPPRIRINPRPRGSAAAGARPPLRRFFSAARPRSALPSYRPALSPPRRNIVTAALIESAINAAPFAAAIPVGLWIWSRHTVAPPDEYLVRTNTDGSNIKVTKRGFVWPFQPHFFLKLQPRAHVFVTRATTRDKQELVLTGSITFGPKDNREDLLRFAKLVLSSEEGAQCSQTERLLLEGVLETEFCRLCENLSFSQISSAGKAFKNVLAKGMQRELDEFGVHIYEVLISELKHSKQVAKTEPRRSTALQKFKAASQSLS